MFITIIVSQNCRQVRDWIRLFSLRLGGSGDDDGWFRKVVQLKSVFENFRRQMSIEDAFNSISNKSRLLSSKLKIIQNCSNYET
jgi:hypothetical protein